MVMKRGIRFISLHQCVATSSSTFTFTSVLTVSQLSEINIGNTGNQKPHWIIDFSQGGGYLYFQY